MSVNVHHVWNLRNPVLADNPSQWPELPPEMRRLLIPASGLYTPEQARILDGIAAARWFLLRNIGPHGYAWRCRNCKQIHDYFTLSCVAVPLNGLTHTIGLMVERMPGSDVFSAVAMGAIEPLTVPQAKKLYDRLRSMRYTREHLLGR